MIVYVEPLRLQRDGRLKLRNWLLGKANHSSFDYFTCRDRHAYLHICVYKRASKVPENESRSARRRPRCDTLASVCIVDSQPLNVWLPPQSGWSRCEEATRLPHGSGRRDAMFGGGAEVALRLQQRLPRPIFFSCLHLDKRKPTNGMQAEFKWMLLGTILKGTTPREASVIALIALIIFHGFLSERQTAHTPLLLK